MVVGNNYLLSVVCYFFFTEILSMASSPLLHNPPRCSTVFSLPEGKMLSYFGIVPEGHILDIPNGILGMMFYLYTFIAYFTHKNKSHMQSTGGINFLFSPMINLVINSAAIASSAFLARKLYLIRELCVVCVTTHIINMTLWIRACRKGLYGRHHSEKLKTK